MELKIDEVIEHCDRQVNQISRFFDMTDDEILKSNFGKTFMEHKLTAEWLRELKAYRDAEEQGKLIHLPCKVGDDIYEFENIDIESCLKNGFCYSDIYVQWTVKSFEIDDLGDIWIHTYRKDPFSYSERVLKADEIGKTVFMTRKEAIEGMAKR